MSTNRINEVAKKIVYSIPAEVLVELTSPQSNIITELVNGTKSRRVFPITIFGFGEEDVEIEGSMKITGSIVLDSIKDETK